MPGVGDDDFFRAGNPLREGVRDRRDEWRLVVADDDERWNPDVRELRDRHGGNTTRLGMRIQQILSGIRSPEPPVSIDNVVSPRRNPRDWAREHDLPDRDRKSTRLNSSHVSISYAVFC